MVVVAVVVAAMVVVVVGHSLESVFNLHGNNVRGWRKSSFWGRYPHFGWSVLGINADVIVNASFERGF